jgi:serine/threonine protein kinase
VGKFSTVREGISKVNGRSYAIKIMDKTSLDEKEKEALRTEIAVLKLIQHPGVIKLKNVFETRRQIHIVMSYISGGDLFDVLAIQKTYSERAARSLVKHLLEILEYLHLRGIVHRDLKPENILMKTDEAKRVYHDDIILADFGLSKFNIPTQVMDLACGTLAYVAPEVLQEEGYGKEVDLWAVGVILYLVIRGQLPFDSNDQQEIITKTIEAKIDFDHAVFALNDTGVSTECRDVISQLLQKDPAQRVNATEALQHPWFALDLGPCRTDENLREDRSDNDTTTTTTTTTTAPVSPLKSPLAKLVVPTPTTTVAPVVVASGVVPYLAEFEQDSATEDIMNELDSLEVDVETQSTLDELFDLGLESSPVSPILSPDAFAERRRSITQEEDSELIDDL